MGSQLPGSANGDEEFDLTGARFGGTATPYFPASKTIPAAIHFPAFQFGSERQDPEDALLTPFAPVRFAKVEESFQGSEAVRLVRPLSS